MILLNPQLIKMVDQLHMIKLESTKLFSKSLTWLCTYFFELAIISIHFLIWLLSSCLSCVSTNEVASSEMCSW